MYPENQKAESAIDTGSESPKLQPKSARVNILRIVFSLLFASALLIFVLRGVKWNSVGAILAGSNYVFVASAIVAYYASYIFRAARWTYMLRGIGQKLGIGASLSLILSSYAINCIVPAKAGDILRSYVSSRKGTAGFFTVLGTVAAERVADLLCVLFAFVIGAALFAGHLSTENFLGSISSKLLISIGAALLLIVAVLLLVTNIEKVLGFVVPARFQDEISGIKRGFFGALSRPLPVMVYTIAVWVLELGSFALALAAVALSPGFGESLFTASAATLSNAVPFTPGGLGAYELASREILVAAGRDKETVIASIIIIRLINYWSLIFVGALTAGLSGIKFKSSA